MNFWQRHWKKLVGAVVAIAVVVAAGSFIYAKFINDAPDATTKDDAIAATQQSDPTALEVDDTVVNGSASSAPTTASAPKATTAPATSGNPDGGWTIGAESFVRYRVTESINGFDTEGVGESEGVTGTLTIAGTTAPAASFTVDMTTFSSDKGQRDGQFNGRIMAVDEFPTSTFVLTSPIDFGSIPASGESATAPATGDLTLRGVTKSVTFELNAAYDNDIVAVQGSIPILFSDYSIPNPSFATISTEDNGALEFVLVFERT